MGVSNHIKGRKASLSTDFAPFNPTLFERLEPRILLSGDGLLSAAAPDPFLDTMPQVVQHAELLEPSEHIERQPDTQREINQQVGPSCPDGTDLLQPIFALSVEQSNVADDGDPSVLDEASATEALQIAVGEPATHSPAVPVEDGSMPTYTDDADLSIEYATSIEIRGPPAQAEAAFRSQIVLIDSALKDDFQLKNADNLGVVVEVLSAESDGIQQISDILSNYQDVSAIHIISHGSPGQVQIGSVELNATSLDFYAEKIQTWGDALTQDGDILFYGCSIAQGESGSDLLDRIAELTEADVAASINPTGNIDLNGDWVLEEKTGVIETELPNSIHQFTEFDGLLGITINEVDSDTTGTDTAEFIELYDGGAGNTSLDGLVLVLFNGDDDASYDSIDLDGYSTNPNGYFVLGNAGVTNVDLVFPDDTIQNGADAVALYAGDETNFPNGTPVTTDNLLDAFVYDTGQADDTGLLVLLNGGQPQVNEDGAGNRENHSNARIPDGGTQRNTSTFDQHLPSPGVTNGNYVNFADANLKTAVEAALGVVDPTTTDMLGLSSLNASSLGITNLTGLEYATNLSSLSLYRNQISDLSPLGGLTNLTYLALSENQISSISTLGGLTNMHHLELADNLIAEIGPLSGFSSLTYLRLGGNQVTDVGPLSGLTTLTELHITGNQISAIGPLSSLVNLQSLDLGGNQISDMTPLAGLTNLQWLSLWGNQITAIPDLSALTVLTDLNLQNNQISAISGLSGLTSLTGLYLHNNQIVNISTLADLTVLTYLDMGGNQIGDMTPVAGLTNLQWLNLWGNQISAIPDLSALTVLTELNLHNNLISDISVLAGLTSLTRLDLGGNQITDLSDLLSLTNLTWLSLNNTGLSSIGAVAGLTNLTGLDLGNNPLGDIADLEDLTNLTWLSLSNTGLSSIGALAGLTNLTGLDLNNNPLGSTADLEDLTNLTWLSLSNTGLS
ncbi:MAG: leucine-rich repeat domain-containing protein, partial [Phycisphaerae bacterium]|nr:leucine-rich repeat domain-containing protein [Phycisphaerae bacterium]